jgi:hypothetical protein
MSAPPDADARCLVLSLHCVRCLLATAAPPDQLGLGNRCWVQRRTPVKPAFVAQFSVQTRSAISPLLSSFGAMENRHFNSLKMPESRLTSSVGGRENPKHLSTPQTPLPSQMCQHQQVFTTMCTCVSIFTIIFFEGINHSTCHAS